jgi:glycerate kinase
VRVLIAPDKFAGTLTAVEAAEAIAEGWRRHAPDDVLDLVPMADGGPGFVDVMHASVGGRLITTTVTGPHGRPVPASFLLAGEGSAYIESAMACGLALLDVAERDPEHLTSLGVGELVAQAISAGATRVVVGLGGSATNDAGAGMLAGLGATSDPPGLLTAGPAGFEGLNAVHLDPARRRVSGIPLVVASDVDNPLLGLIGTTKNYGPQKGLVEDRISVVDAWLARFAGLADKRRATMKGAGAAGGLGYAFGVLGAELVPGVELVAEATSLALLAGVADLVITGEGSLDFSSQSGKVPQGVAGIAQEALRPCIVLAGQVFLGSRELRAMGIESAYSVTEALGEERSLGEPVAALADLAERVARTWSRGD